MVANISQIGGPQGSGSGPEAQVSGPQGPQPGVTPSEGGPRSGLPVLTPRALLRFLSGLLLGLVIGLALLIAAALTPALVGFYPMVVASGSMEPTLHTGDVAVVRKISPYDLQIGDVATYATAGGTVTHRIVGLDVTPQGPFFLMRGDANLTTDPRSIPAQAIVGKVVYRVPRLGFLVDFANSLPGRVLFIGTPLVVLALLWSRRILGRLARALPLRGGPKA